VLQRAIQQLAKRFRLAAEAEERANKSADPTCKADYHRLARSWQTLAGSYQFQDSLGHFIRFNESKSALDAELSCNRPLLRDPSANQVKPYFLDRLAQSIDGIPPWSAEALAISVMCVVIASVFRVWVGWTPTDLRFAIYLPAILAAGLLGGVPAAVGVTATSLLIMLWAFVPPYFKFKWPNHSNGETLVIYFLSSIVTVYFAHCCRMVLRRLSQRDLNNQLVLRELRHRRRNLFSVIQLIVKRSLAHEPDVAETIFGRVHSILRASELLSQNADRPVTLKSLLLQEFAVYGEDRLDVHGAELSLALDTAQHLLLIFHELATNAAKYGSLSSPKGRVSVEWRWNGGRRLALTWKESGGPVATPPNKDGFGSQLIDLCINALSGTIESSYLPDGYSYSITVRLSK
jgi:two-component sensor histidine kinase